MLLISDSESVKVTQSCPTLWDPMDCIVHGILQDRILERVAFLFSRGSSQPMNPTLQVDSLPAESQGKPKNTGVGSLSLLQGIFPIQESTQGFLHCRWILYQLSYQSSPQNCYINWVHARIWLFSHHLTTFSKSSYTVLVIAASCSS